MRNQTKSSMGKLLFLIQIFTFSMGCQSSFLFFGKNLSLNKPSPEAVGALTAAIYHSLKQEDYKAEKWILNALQEDPNSAPLYFVAAKIYFQRKKITEGLQALEKAVNLASHHTSLLVDIGEFYEKNGYFTQALKIYIGLIQKKKYVKYLAQRIINLLKFLGKPSISLYVLQEILPHIPDTDLQRKIQIQIAKSLRFLGKFKEAQKYLQQIQSFSPDMKKKILLEKIYIYSYSQKLSLAMKLCYQGIQKYPLYLPFRYALAQILEAQGEYQQAVIIWKDLLSLLFQKGKSISTLSLSQKYSLAGEIHLKLGNEEEGIRFLLKSLEINQLNKKALLILKDYFIAKKKYYLATRLMEAYLFRIPHDFEIKSELAYLYSLSGVHLDRAIQYSTEALQAFPHFGKALFALGWAYLQKLEFHKALSSLLQAYTYYPSLETSEALGYLFFCLGNLEESQKWYLLAKKYNPKEKNILFHLKWIESLKKELAE